MSSTSLNLLDQPSPITDNSLPIVCAKIDVLTSSPLPPLRLKRHRRIKPPTSEHPNLTIYSSRSDVLKDPVVRSAYLKAKENSNTSVDAAVAVRPEGQEGFRSLCEGDEPDIGSDSPSDSSHQSQRHPGSFDDQIIPKDEIMSTASASQSLREIERIGRLQAHDALPDNKATSITLNPSLLSFPGDVIIDKNAALARLFALTEDAASRADAVGVMTGPFAGRTAFWTDASCLASGSDDAATGCGLGVVYRPQDMPKGSDERIVEGYRIPRPIEITAAETLAIFWALLIAETRFGTSGEAQERERTVLIFSDCQNALRCIESFEHRGPTDTMVIPNEIIQMIWTKAQQLTEMGLKIELHWVPGHKGVVGNELADEVAKQAAKGKQLENRTSAHRRGKPISFDREVISLACQ